MKYRLKTALTAVVSESRGRNGECRLVTIEAGDEIAILGSTLDAGLVEGLHKGERVTLLQTDIVHRAHLIEDASA